MSLLTPKLFSFTYKRFDNILKEMVFSLYRDENPDIPSMFDDPEELSGDDEAVYRFCAGWDRTSKGAKTIENIAEKKQDELHYVLLAVAYATAWNGFTTNKIKAKRFAMTSAEEHYDNTGLIVKHYLDLTSGDKELQLSAFNEIKKMADSDFVPAIEIVASCYQLGYIVPKDIKQAICYYLRCDDYAKSSGGLVKSLILQNLDAHPLFKECADEVLDKTVTRDISEFNHSVLLGSIIRTTNHLNGFNLGLSMMAMRRALTSAKATLAIFKMDQAVLKDDPIVDLLIKVTEEQVKILIDKSPDQDDAAFFTHDYDTDPINEAKDYIEYPAPEDLYIYAEPLTKYARENNDAEIAFLLYMVYINPVFFNVDKQLGVLKLAAHLGLPIAMTHSGVNMLELNPVSVKYDIFGKLHYYTFAMKTKKLQAKDWESFGKAFEIIEKAWNAGYAPAITYLFAQNFYGICKEADHNKLLEMIKPFLDDKYVMYSDTGHYMRYEFESVRGLAKLYYAYLLHEGEVVPQDDVSAKEFAEEAIEYFPLQAKDFIVREGL